jgi:hypothetical protein
MHQKHQGLDIIGDTYDAKIKSRATRWNKRIRRSKLFSRECRHNFIKDSVHRASQYIDLGIWKGIERHKFDKWKEQYKTEEEKILLAFILNALIYRSKEQTTALIEQAIYKSIPQCVYTKTGNEDIFKEIERIQSKRDVSKDILITPVIRDFDPPTKSGPLVARLFKRLGNVSEKTMCWPWTIKNYHEAKYVILLDDFVGTGEQFIKFYNTHISERKNEGCTTIYCPLTATATGIKNISEKIPDILLCPIETLSEKENFFNYSADKFGLNASEQAELSNAYDKFIKKSGFKNIGKKGKKNMERGYGELSLCYAYEHATPNASTPLLWANSESYTSLFER